MGYSPGELYSKDGKCSHWELRNGRIVLWNSDESKKHLDLGLEQSMVCFDQLKLLITMQTGQNPCA